MKAFLYSDWNKLEICDQPQPSFSPDEVLLKVTACGLCGSELETFKSQSPRRSPPLILGHEFCGEVSEVGDEVDGISIGDKLISYGLVPCERCPACRRGDMHLCCRRQVFGMHRMGAFAEFVNVPAHCLIAWPEALPAEAACLTEPVANGVHVVNLTRHLEPKTVLVIGAGSIGLMCQQTFQCMMNAEVMVADINPDRLEVAERIGAKTVIKASEEDVVAVAQGYAAGEGVDLVIDAVGSSKTKRQSLGASRRGGGAVWIGLYEDSFTFHSYEITLTEKHVFGSYSAKLSECQTAIDLMVRGQVDVASWVQKFSLDEAVEAFYRMLAPKGNDIKAVIVP